MTTAAPLRRPTAPPPPVAPADRKPPTAPAPRLVVVSPRRSPASRLPFLILVGAIMVVGLVGVLLLHMLAAQDAYRANHLQQRLTTLTDAEQRLSRLVDSDSAPAALRQRARALGMVPATISGFHKLHDGRTVGLQAPVQPPAAPTVTQPTTPAAKPSAGKPAAHHARKPATTSTKPGHSGHPGKPTGQQKKSAATAKHPVKHPVSKHPASKHHHSTTQ
jgi:hypothetical protein